MSTFTLKIELSNAAMQTPADVADALRKVADRLDEPGASFMEHDGAKIHDLNGNTVGLWAADR